MAKGIQLTGYCHFSSPSHHLCKGYVINGDRSKWYCQCNSCHPGNPTNNGSALPERVIVPEDSTPPAVTESNIPKPAGPIGDIRSWARQNGFSVGERGRISQEIQDAYRKAKA